MYEQLYYTWIQLGTAKNWPHIWDVLMSLGHISGINCKGSYNLDEHDDIIRADRKSQVMQCLGFCSSDS